MRKVASALFTISECVCVCIYIQQLYICNSICKDENMIREKSEWMKHKTLETSRYGLEEVIGKREKNLGFGAKRWLES